MSLQPSERRRTVDRTVIRNLGGPAGTGLAAAVPVGFRHGMRVGFFSPRSSPWRWAFFLNGVSFVAVLIAIWTIRTAPTPANTKPNAGVFAEFGEAMRYVRRRRGLVLGIASAVLVAFFGHPITQFIVVFADEVYEVGPGVLGVPAASVGAGAVLAVPALSAWDGRVPRSTLVRWGLPVYALSVIAFGVAPSWPLGLATMLVVGGGFLVVIATTNTALQMIVADDMRGRVLSARVMGCTLAFPLGSLVQGVLADLIGPQPAVIASGSCLFVVSCALAAKPALLRSLDAETDAEDARPQHLR